MKAPAFHSIVESVASPAFFSNVLMAITERGLTRSSLMINVFCICLLLAVFFIAYYTWKDRQNHLKSMEDPTSRELQTLPPYKVAMCSMVMSRTSSRVMGYVMKMNIPRVIRKPMYSTVCKVIGINVDEFEGSYEDYPNPNSFFTRSLKADARRVVRHEDILVSPCDSTVSYMDCNPITTPNLKAHQVKGVRYLLSEFLGQPIPTENKANNMYTITLYLSPSDYHRVHSPTCFSMTSRIHFPGKLLPVKNYYAENVKGLFTINERVVLNGTWKEGFFSLGMVGAYNVGSISLANPQDSELRTNRIHRSKKGVGKNYCYRKEYAPSVDVLPGDPVGTFHLGSTVVLAFESSEFTWLVKPGEKVKMGQPIGIIRHSEGVDELIDPSVECDVDATVTDDDYASEMVSPVSPDVSDEDATENIEIETKGNYVMEVVKDLYHAGMRIYRMRSIRNINTETTE